MEKNKYPIANITTIQEKCETALFKCFSRKTFFKSFELKQEIFSNIEDSRVI